MYLKISTQTNLHPSITSILTRSLSTIDNPTLTSSGPKRNFGNVRCKWFNLFIFDIIYNVSKTVEEIGRV